MAEKTFEGAEATQEDAPVSLWLDSPYQISKIIGEYYSNYYFSRHGLPAVKARFQNVYGPGEVLGAGRWRGTVNTVWRNVMPTFIYKALEHEALPVENGGIASRDFIYVGDMARGLIACALRGEPGGVYNLASGVETTIRELAETDQRADRQPDADRAHAGPRLGPLGAALRRHREDAPRARLRGDDAAARGARAHDRVDAREPRVHRRCIAKHAERMAAAGGCPGVSARAARALAARHGDRTGRGAAWAEWRELWARRELLYVLARRDVAIRYKQSVIGALWAVVQPLSFAAVFSLFFGLLTHIKTGRSAVSGVRDPRDGHVAVFHGRDHEGLWEHGDERLPHFEGLLPTPGHPARSRARAGGRLRGRVRRRPRGDAGLRRRPARSGRARSAACAVVLAVALAFGLWLAAR